MSFGKKNTENSKRLGGEARPGIEPGTSRLPVLSAEPLHQMWGFTFRKEYKMKESTKDASFLVTDTQATKN